MTGDERIRASASSRMVLPLALAQFVASYAATNMNVAITAIADDLNTNVRALQTAITLFTLVMAALMIPGSKLTDIWGRKVCFLAGLGIYGTGALVATLAPGIGAMIIGYSVLEGVGSALMIPPIYILITVAFTDVADRARWFGVVSGAGGLGAAAGPLIGGVITTAIGWRASFTAQVLVVAVTAVLAWSIVDPGPAGPRPRFDFLGAALSGLGLLLVVLGFNASGTYGWGAARQDLLVGSTVVVPAGGISPVWYLLGLGLLVLAGFVLHLARTERRGGDPLLHLRLFRSRTANLGLGTQVVQWLVLQGSFFVISVFLQKVRGYNAISTGLALTPSTLGILIASGAARRLARRRPQRELVVGGFGATFVGFVLILALVRSDSNALALVPGLLLEGLGVGVMLTSSVNIVQSSFPDADQGDISGLSRSVSNLGSSLGTALVGSVMVSVVLPGGKTFAVALALLGVIALLGLVLAVLIPGDPAAVDAANRGGEHGLVGSHDGGRGTGLGVGGGSQAEGRRGLDQAEDHEPDAEHEDQHREGDLGKHEQCQTCQEADDTGADAGATPRHVVVHQPPAHLHEPVDDPEDTQDQGQYGDGDHEVPHGEQADDE
jgi:MFS family permease